MILNEVSPPGWGHTKAEKEKTKPNKPKSKIGGSAAAFKRALDDGRFKGLPGSTTKKEKTADMFKLMWSMKKKGDKPHYKPGTDKKYKKYQESLSVKDTRKLNKASSLSQSNNPKDQDRARARQVEPVLVMNQEREHLSAFHLLNVQACQKQKEILHQEERKQVVLNFMANQLA